MISSKVAALTKSKNNLNYFSKVDDLFFKPEVIFIAYEECCTIYAGIKVTPPYKTIGRSYYYLTFGNDYNYD